MRQEHKELLRELYETYQKALRLAAFWKKVPECEVDDIIQDTFVAFMDNYGDRFPDWNDAQIKGMLMKILYNRCNDYFRNKQRHEEISIDTVQVQEKRDAGSSLIEKEELEMIRKVISDMSPALREVAILHMIEGRPRSQVCKILNINDATCRMRISRIRSRIQKLLKEQG